MTILEAENSIGKEVKTIDGHHSGILIKTFHATGHGQLVHIKEQDGRIYYCPLSYVIK